MTQPILFKNSISIALLAAAEAVLAGVLVVISIYAAAHFGGLFTADNEAALLCAAVISCLIMIRRPLDAGEQLTIQPGKAAAAVMLRFCATLIVLTTTGWHLTPHLLSEFTTWIWAAITMPALGLITLMISVITQRLLINAASNRKAVFAGYNDISLTLAERLEREPSLCLKACGFFDDRSVERLGLNDPTAIKGTLLDLVSYVKEHSVDVIFVSLPIRHLKRVVDLLDDLHDTTASIYYVPDVFVFDLIQARSTEISGIPVVAMCETPFYGYRGIAKRLLDISVASCAILALSPILLLTALAVKLTSPGPVIFKQYRYGLDGGEIAVFKFRSMKVTENGNTIKQASKNDSRITPVGSFLRRSSIDELPQLFNVLNGTMSLVGPRPHAVAHNEQYRKLIKGYMIRHKVLPGITGLAQISGCRGETARVEEMEKRVKYDLEYLRHWTPLLDIKILLLTALKIFNDKNAY